MLAPHPFYQARGTPIDVELFARALAERPGTTVDLLTYGEGEDRPIPGVTHYRAPDWSLVRGIRPGFSVRKLLADALLFGRAIQLVRRHRYDVVHAGEEAVFIAMVLERMVGLPFVYDLDSSLPQQLVESRPILAPVRGALERLEDLALHHCLAAAPVCDALAEICIRGGAGTVVTLYDVSLLEPSNDGPARVGPLRAQFGADRLLLLYAGNLEPYQGVDLLLAAFSQAATEVDHLDLVVVGGRDDDVARYREVAAGLGISERSHFLGPRPFEQLGGLLADADIVTAPRIRGINTPMKIFPYLHSGRPVLVTRLPMHTQILTPETAFLADPTPEGFARAIVTLATDAELRERLGRAGRAFVERNHTYEAHRRRVFDLYDRVAEQLPRTGRPSASGPGRSALY